MPGEAQITIVGNLTADPETRQVGNGTVTSFSVAQTPRVKQQDGSYGDGEPTFYRVSAWRELGEHAAASLTKGSRVIVMGAFSSRSYEVNGEKRVSNEVTAEALGPELRFAVAIPQRDGGGRSPAGNSQPQQRAQQAPRQQQAPAQQAWASGGYDDETPF